MARLPRHTLLLILGLPVVSAAPPGRVYAQLVRQGTTTPGQQAATGQNSMKSQTSLGKKRLSQEVQLTGDASWMDTGIDVQPGEHVVITATGKLRYSEAKEDNGPDGLARGFRDLLRILPFNEAGRGALIGRIGDKDVAQPFLLGSEPAMQQVFTAAGWVKVDADVQDAILHGVLESISKESYVTMPMSQLYLFGRPQDYGWAHAEPISVVKTRNHLRIWKAPYQVHGETLWVGAATHDIGLERDQRNNGITHKIDPDIDLERDYLEKTLSSTGLVSEITYLLPDHPLKEATPATVGRFHSNGKVLVLKLAESATTLSILKRRASTCSARVGLLRNWRSGVLGIFYFSGSNSNSMTRSTSSACASGSFSTSPPLTTLTSTVVPSRNSFAERTPRGMPASASNG